MNRNTFTGLIKKLEKNQIFVFGSNPEGRHGLGTARIALIKYGAKYGQGHGLQGRSYGIVTKNLKKNFYDEVLKITYNKAGMRSISKQQMTDNIKNFYKVAREMKDKEFLVAYTAEGSNLNGYTNKEMADMFYDAKPIPKNVIFEDKFTKLIYERK